MKWLELELPSPAPDQRTIDNILTPTKSYKSDFSSFILKSDNKTVSSLSKTALDSTAQMALEII